MVEDGIEKDWGKEGQNRQISGFLKTFCQKYWQFQK